MSSLTAARRTRRLLIQIAAASLVTAAVTTGVWVAGGVVTDDFRSSAALTTAWFLIAGGACLVVASRHPLLRVPVMGSFLLTAGAIGLILASTTLRDRVVAEDVVTATVSPVALAARGTSADPVPSAQPQNVELARGRFTSGEHATRGTAAVIRLPDGRRFLTLTSFSTSPGPDLRVRLASARTLDAGDGVDLGALKGNRGDQQYRIPAGASLRGRAVVIWCRAFSARFGSAVLGLERRAP